MPVRVGKKTQLANHPADDRVEDDETPMKKDEFNVATDLYFINVSKQ